MTRFVKTGNKVTTVTFYGTYIPYKWYYWRALNLAIWFQTEHSKILAEFQALISKPPYLIHRQYFHLYGVCKLKSHWHIHIPPLYIAAETVTLQILVTERELMWFFSNKLLEFEHPYT